MKQYCNLIHIYLIHQVQKIENGLVVAKPGETPIVVHAADYEIAPAVTDGKSSLLSSVQHTLYIDKLPDSAAKLLKIKRSAIIQFNRDEHPFTLGSLQYPAKVIHAPNLNIDMLKIEQKQPVR